MAILGLGVKERREEMENTIKKMGSNGMEVKELIKLFANKWGVHISTIKRYVSDLKCLDKVKIEGPLIYHSIFLTPKERR